VSHHSSAQNRDLHGVSFAQPEVMLPFCSDAGGYDTAIDAPLLLHAAQQVTPARAQPHTIDWGA
jgi:hypothetical protein